MPVRVGINGFGRIGRNVFRAAHEAAAPTSSGSPSTTSPTPQTLAHLLKYDSILGPFPGTVEARRRRASSSTARRWSGCSPSATRRTLPWGELGVDVVIESTGLFTDRADAAQAPRGRAPRRSSSRRRRPSPDVTVVLGVNFDEAYDREPPRRHLERLVHDELPRAGREGRSTRRSASSTA